MTCLPEVNEMLRGILFWCLSVVETLIERLHEVWDDHSCLFLVKTSSKEEGMSVFHAPHCRWTEAFIQRSVVPNQRAPKRHSLFEFPEENGHNRKMRLCFLSKVTIYKTGCFQWSSTRAVIKTLLYLFGKQTERTVPKIFSTNTCTVTTLVFVKYFLVFSGAWQVWSQCCLKKSWVKKQKL